MRRFQFSLRTLLIVVAILAVPCWYVGEQWRIGRERQAMRERLYRIGGAVRLPFFENDPPAVPWVRSLLGDEGVFGIFYPPLEDRKSEDEGAIETAFPEAKNLGRLIKPRSHHTASRGPT